MREDLDTSFLVAGPLKILQQRSALKDSFADIPDEQGDATIGTNSDIHP